MRGYPVLPAVDRDPVVLTNGQIAPMLYVGPILVSMRRLRQIAVAAPMKGLHVRIARMWVRSARQLAMREVQVGGTALAPVPEFVDQLRLSAVLRPRSEAYLLEAKSMLEGESTSDTAQRVYEDANRGYPLDPSDAAGFLVRVCKAEMQTTHQVIGKVFTVRANDESRRYDFETTMSIAYRKGAPPQLRPVLEFTTRPKLARVLLGLI